MSRADPREQGEKCQSCGRRYALVWWAPADVWTAVTGREHDSNGLFCPDCFHVMALDQGVLLKWVPTELVDDAPALHERADRTTE